MVYLEKLYLLYEYTMKCVVYCTKQKQYLLYEYTEMCGLFKKTVSIYSIYCMNILL